ncbi:hypothetical protein JTE90_001357 [Oedothorax gibbosus]|uniref:Uncharacterized protein n=1 Tax=Oedothorax gibbosus TaxID=931172 RepID=A0AAV6VFR7_9ARAC|nr:hypothetical protein JTE90_001357 [Oedothorax gibbosus]
MLCSIIFKAFDNLNSGTEACHHHGSSGIAGQPYLWPHPTEIWDEGGDRWIPGTEAMPHHDGFQGGIAELLAAGVVVSLIQQNNLGRRRRSLDSVVRQNVL